MSFTSLPSLAPPKPKGVKSWLLPAVMLALAYGLLSLTFTEHLPHAEMMRRCVLADPKMSRIWSVGNVEIGLAYLGVFIGMVWYFVGIYRKSRTHLMDLGLAVAYLVASFTLDYLCVLTFSPFYAMLVGDAIVMTFTVAVSRQVWFQRLLGVFVPIIFLTCGIGHFLEGISYWKLTYPVNVPWTMVTADVGFAVLVNAARFPAFIRGEDVVSELAQSKARAEEMERALTAQREAEAENTRLLSELQKQSHQQKEFLRDVLASVTEGRLLLCSETGELPPLPSGETAEPIARIALESSTLSHLRAAVREVAQKAQHDAMRVGDLAMAASEAGMNAVVHAGGGWAAVYSDADTGRVQIRIEDHGKGIDMNRIPRATLERGYTTAGTLGHGFWLILKTADRVYLHTGPEGTTVVIEQEREPAEPQWME